MSGRIELMFNSIVAILPHIQSGKLRALAVTSRKRSALLPDVPTVAESGWPEYEAGSWYGILAPAGTPPAVIERLHSEIVKSLKDRRGAEAARRRRRRRHRQHAAGIRCAHQGRARAHGSEPCKAAGIKLE